MQENSNLDIAERTYANLEVYRALLGSLILFINKGAIGNFNRFERMFIGVFKIRSSMPDLERVDVLRELVLKGYPWEIASGEYLNKLEETLIAANFHLREVLYDDCRDSQGYNGEDYEEGDAMLMARQACAAGIEQTLWIMGNNRQSVRKKDISSLCEPRTDFLDVTSHMLSQIDFSFLSPD